MVSARVLALVDRFNEGYPSSTQMPLKFHIFLSHAGGEIVLDQTQFWAVAAPSTQPTTEMNSKTSGIQRTHTFRWNSGERALCVLMLRAFSLEDPMQYSLQGGKATLARSLVEILGDKHAKNATDEDTWIVKMFGGSGPAKHDARLPPSLFVRQGNSDRDFFRVSLGRDWAGANFAVFLDGSTKPEPRNRLVQLADQLEQNATHGRHAKPAPLIEPIRDLLMHRGNSQCSICHGSDQVDVFPIPGTETLKKQGVKDVTVVCGRCFERALLENLAPEYLRAVRDAWWLFCKNGKSPKDILSMEEHAYAEAIRLSLSTSLWDVKRAIVQCEAILHYFNPFNADVRLLLERLKAADVALTAQEVRKDTKAHAPLSDMFIYRLYKFGGLVLIGAVAYNWANEKRLLVGLVSVLAGASCILVFKKTVNYIITILGVLPCTLIEESVHVIGAYILIRPKNAFGKKMPFSKMTDYIEINGLPLWEGIRDALKTGVVQEALVNLSKMHREWYTEVEF